MDSLDEVESWDEFGAALENLADVSRFTRTQLVSMIDKHIHAPGASHAGPISTTTLWRIFTGRSRPQKDVLDAMLEILRLPFEDADDIRRAWQRLVNAKVRPSTAKRQHVSGARVLIGDPKILGLFVSIVETPNGADIVIDIADGNEHRVSLPGLPTKTLLATSLATASSSRNVTGRPAQRAQIYINSESSGRVSYDFQKTESYLIGSGSKRFDVRWTRPHSYSSTSSLELHCVLVLRDLHSLADLGDLSARAPGGVGHERRSVSAPRFRAAMVGDVAVMRNGAGYFAALRVEDIQSSNVTFSYVISARATADFTDPPPA